MRGVELAGAILATGALTGSTLAASNTFYSSRHACPQTCSAVGDDTSNWTVYRRLNRLNACNETMLLNFNIYNPVDDPDTTVKISACVADSDASVTKRSGTNSTTLVASTSAVQTNGTNTAIATVQISSVGSGNTASTSNVIDASAQLQSFVANGPTAEKTVRFAYADGAVIGVYSGSHIDSTSTTSLLQKLSDLFTAGKLADTTVMQVCGDGINANNLMGVVADTTGSGLSYVQDIVASWTNASCIDLGSGTDVTSSNITMEITRQQASPISTTSSLKPRHAAHGRVVLPRDDTCSYIQVVSGDTCSSLATECGITAAEFTDYNPSSTECSTLVVGEYVCCSSGDLPDFAPSAYANGTCYTYLVQSGDYCSLIAAEYDITTDDIETWNEDTWGWTGCDDLLADVNICLSDGDPPMPNSLSNAECGPQVPGSTAPSDMSTLASLNPCPLNACCDIWGQCGVTSEFCTISNSTTGAPGTAASGQNGCISNCGQEVVNNDDAPDSVMAVAYYEVFSLDRPCLTMSPDEISGIYTHVHFAFGNITSDYEINVSGYSDEFSVFLENTAFKRIISFGGWSFSTDASTYNIFREAVTADNRATFVKNVVNFVEEYNVDGVDFDWEYPGEPDIPDIPAGNDDDGDNYLQFLTDLRAALSSDVSISIAAPASYWYLKQFPIANISTVVDYIIYMTYDLHGQWDYGKTDVDPGCSDGNCLRSHVNLTETYEALTMITKAGVKANKVVVGISSYGRSFQMTDSDCFTPECTYTGPDSGATPGRCTQTAGYISNAELTEILANSSYDAITYTDGTSFSDIMLYDGNWVAYMNTSTKETRVLYYNSLNFAGTSDWAVDLQAFLAACSMTATMTVTGLPYQTVNCENPAITNADQDQSDRWDEVGTDTAIEIFLLDYFYQQDSTSLTFPEYVSNFFHGPEGMDCGETSADVGCEAMSECSDVNYPAGYLILNSFVAVHDFLYNAFEACTSAEADMQSSIDAFSSTFAQIEDVATEVDNILTVLGFFYALVVAPLWVQFAVSDANQNYLSIAKDATGTIISNGVTLLKASSIWATPDDNTAELSYYMGQMIKTAATAISGTNTDLFNGSASSVADLYRVIDEGKLSEITSTVGDLGTEAALEHSLYAVMIPYAWSLSNENTHPVVINTGEDCSDVWPSILQDYIAEDTANEVAVCYNDVLYYLADARDCNVDCSHVYGQGSTTCAVTKLFAPLGIDSLDGTNWGGVTIANLTIAAINGYTSNGNANGWSYNDPTNAADLDSIWDNGINAAGVNTIPVCDMGTVFANWVECDISADNYPCQSLT
ncbi:hypothetical protein BX600DRAFT_391288 [Xylariales sp. PMI_506]|nr:hypothetical protein BX600DRAFT_391288 [Xylariales sp. PMI_506]